MDASSRKYSMAHVNECGESTRYSQCPVCGCKIRIGRPCHNCFWESMLRASVSNDVRALKTLISETKTQAFFEHLVPTVLELHIKSNSIVISRLFLHEEEEWQICDRVWPETICLEGIQMHVTEITTSSPSSTKPLPEFRVCHLLPSPNLLQLACLTSLIGASLSGDTECIGILLREVDAMRFEDDDVGPPETMVEEIIRGICHRLSMTPLHQGEIETDVEGTRDTIEQLPQWPSEQHQRDERTLNFADCEKARKVQESATDPNRSTGTLECVVIDKGSNENGPNGCCSAGALETTTSSTEASQTDELSFQSSFISEPSVICSMTNAADNAKKLADLRRSKERQDSQRVVHFSVACRNPTRNECELAAENVQVASLCHYISMLCAALHHCKQPMELLQNSEEAKLEGMRGFKTSLMMAAERGDSASVEILLGAGVKPNATNNNNGVTALMCAVLGGTCTRSVRLVARLDAAETSGVLLQGMAGGIEDGGVCISNRYLQTEILGVNCIPSSEESEAMLLSSDTEGFDVEATNHPMENIRRQLGCADSPNQLLYTTQSATLDPHFQNLKMRDQTDRLGCVEMLIRAGADPNARTKCSCDTMRPEHTPLLQSGTGVLHRHHYTALMFSAETDALLTFAKILQDAGVKPDTANCQGCTALSIVALMGLQRNLKLLLTLYAGHESYAELRRHALVYACKGGSVDCVTMLIEDGANIAAPAEYFGKTFSALNIACHAGQEAVVDLLLQRGCRVGVNDIEYAKGAGHAGCLKLLLDSASTEMAKTRGMDMTVPVLVAAAMGETECLSILVNAGADINQSHVVDIKRIDSLITDEQGKSRFLFWGVKHTGLLAQPITALTAAAIFGQEEVVRLLLHGQRNVRAALDPTALLAASTFGHCECVRILVASGADVNWRYPGITDKQGMGSPKNISGPLVRHSLDSGGRAQNLVDRKKKIKSWCTIRDTGTLNNELSRNIVGVQTPLTGKTALMAAIGMNQTECVFVLLRYGAVVDVADTKGLTALMIAAKKGYLSSTRALLDRGASVNMADGEGQTALHYAIRVGNVNCVKCIIEHGAGVLILDTHIQTAVEYGRTDCLAELLNPKMLLTLPTRHHVDPPQTARQLLALDTALMCALDRQQWECLQPLVHAGADVESQDEDGFTPLILAVRRGHLSVVRSLIYNLGADVNCTDYTGASALVHAVVQGRIEIVEVLLENRADANVVDAYGRSLAHHAERSCVMLLLLPLLTRKALECTTHEGDTPLVTHAKKGNLEVLRILVNRGVELDRYNYRGATALICASINGHTDCMEYLLCREANVKSGNITLCGALPLAKSCGLTNCVVSNLKGGIMTEGKEGETCMRPRYRDYFRKDDDQTSNSMVCCSSRKPAPPLLFATAHSSLDYLKARLDVGDNVNEVFESMTSLLLACRNGNARIIDLLVAAGADVNLLSPLLVAARYGHMKCVVKLLEFGADPNVSNDLGSTAILEAFKRQDFACMNVLAKAGARNSEIMSFAARGRQMKVLDVLLKWHPDMIDQPIEVLGQMMTLLSYFVWECSSDGVSFLIERGADVNLADPQGNSPLSQLLFTPKWAKNRHVILLLLLRSRADPNMKVHVKVPSPPKHLGHNILLKYEPENLGEFGVRYFSWLGNARHGEALSPLSLAIHSSQALCAMLLWAAGSDVHGDVGEYMEWPESYAGEPVDRRRMMGFLREIFCEPRSLKDCCRKVIRRCLGYKLQAYLQLFDVPLSLKSYIDLQCTVT